MQAPIERADVPAVVRPHLVLVVASGAGDGLTEPIQELGAGALAVESVRECRAVGRLTEPCKRVWLLRELDGSPGLARPVETDQPAGVIWIRQVDQRNAYGRWPVVRQRPRRRRWRARVGGRGLLRKADWHDLEGVRLALDGGADPNDMSSWRRTA